MNSFYAKYTKRILDVVLSLLAIIVLSPVLLITATLVRIKLGSPVIFKQPRPGKDEKIFNIYKFRTMTNEKDVNSELLSDAVRLTKFGKFLRSTSLDELPELFSILKGDMSVVGPRPLLVRYLPYYHEQERLRSTVRPGITGLAQITGRNALNWSERFQTDVKYVNNLSFLQDLKIIINTVLVVFKRKDILVGDEHVLKDLDLERRGEFKEAFENQKIDIRLINESNLIKNKEVIINLLEDNLKTNFTNLKGLKKFAINSYEDMVKFNKDDSAILVGAFNRKLVVGFIWAYQRELLGEKRIHLDHIIVDYKLRSSGIGSRLLSKLEDIARDKNIFKIELMTTTANENTMRFYSSKNFSTVRVQIEKELDKKNDN